MIDINTLTLGEVAKIEQLSGQGIGTIADQAQPKGLALAALAYVARKRQDPKFTWNDAQALTFAEAQEILGLNDDDDEAAPVEEPADADPFDRPQLADSES